MSEADNKPELEQPREKQSLADFFKEAWSVALVKVGTAEEEAARVLHRAGDLAGWAPDEARRLAGEFAERLAAQRKEFERSLDEGINRAVARLKVPRREEIEALWGRLARLSERIATLQARKKSS